MKIQNKKLASFFVLILLLVKPCQLFLDLRRPTFIRPNKNDPEYNNRESDTTKDLEEYNTFFGYTFDFAKDGGNLK